MTGYLVLARCYIDDVPCGLFEKKEDAISFMNSLTEERVFQVARQAFKLDTSIIHAINVVMILGDTLAEIVAKRDMEKE